MTTGRKKRVRPWTLAASLALACGPHGAARPEPAPVEASAQPEPSHTPWELLAGWVHPERTWAEFDLTFEGPESRLTAESIETLQGVACCLASDDPPKYAMVIVDLDPRAQQPLDLSEFRARRVWCGLVEAGVWTGQVAWLVFSESPWVAPGPMLPADLPTSRVRIEIDRLSESDPRMVRPQQQVAPWSGKPLPVLPPGGGGCTCVMPPPPTP